METHLEEKETGRIEAFSDGVFAIAITLLILELNVPNLHHLNSEHHLIEALVALWPSYLAYFISFFTILIMWVNHHKLFTYIRHTDNNFLFLNGFLLMLVAFIPFPTALLAEHFQHSYAVTATAFYTGGYVLIALAYNFLWHYALYNKLLSRSADHAAVDRITRSYFLGPPLFFLTFALAFFNKNLSLFVFTINALFYAFLIDTKPAKK